jgi:Mg2+ and Co2+ transporter CorA
MTMQLRYFNDGANNGCDWRNFPEVETGEFIKPLIMRRLGTCRHRVWEFRDSSNTKADVIACSIMVESE